MGSPQANPHAGHPMHDSELRTRLAERLLAVDHRVGDACRRGGRRRDEVTLVAVTKTVGVEVAAIVAELGVANLGEGRPQELWRKAELISGAMWHLVGHLQRNKIDKTVPLLTLLHSVDSPRLAEALSEFGAARNEPVPILLEVNCSREGQKHGFAPDSLVPFAETLVKLDGVRVEGLMTMAAYGGPPEASRPAFAELRELRDQLRAATGLPLTQLSMGMSGDFEVGVEEGATLVRVGTTLFEGLT